MNFLLAALGLFLFACFLIIGFVRFMQESYKMALTYNDPLEKLLKD